MSIVTHAGAFWMVWNEDGPGPRVKHETRARAEAEAKRLARANPGQRFVVLESCCAFESNDLVRVTYEHPIPF